MSLTGKSKAGTYKDLLQMNNSNSGISTATRHIVDGEGTISALAISDDNVTIQPQNDDTTSTVRIRAKDGANIFVVNSSDKKIKAGANLNIVNTQYAYFGGNYPDLDLYAANTHYPIPFSAASGGEEATNDVDFGTGTDPDDTFTTANTDTQYASQIVPMMWYVSDDITIDKITHLEGADTATGDTTRMHLKSFTFNSGSTSCLTSGTLLAHTSSDNTNAGNEQVYSRAWTLDSEDVDEGKVILCFFRSDSVNSDYSLNVTIKYHLR